MIVALVVGVPLQPADSTTQAAAKLGMTMGMLVFLIPAIWGLVSAIGLFRMKRWARISTLIFACLLAFFGAVTPIFLLLIPMPSTPGADPAVMAGVKVGVSIFYLILASIGVWWLVYLTRHTVKAQFEVGFVPSHPAACPLSVSIIAWFLIIAGCLLPVNLFFHAPAIVLGAVLTGWAANLVLLVLATLSVIAGVGLLRLRLYGQRLALAYFAIGIVNSVFSFLLPGSAGKFQRVIDAMPTAFKVSNPPPINFAALGVPIIVVTLVPVFFLWKNRSAFAPPQPALGAPPHTSA